MFAPHRQRGYAARAVRLLLELLGRDKTYRVATLLIDAENEPSLRVANAVGAVERQRMTLAEGRPQVLMALPLVSRP